MKVFTHALRNPHVNLIVIKGESINLIDTTALTVSFLLNVIDNNFLDFQYFIEPYCAR